MTWPCHSKPKDEWCDRLGPDGFMGHTCKNPLRTGKFVTPGPLPTLYQKEGLTILMEEAFEVLTFLGPRASKAIRFGLDEVQPGQDLTNKHRLSIECGDIAALFDLLVEAGAIDGKVMNEAIFNKRSKLRKYMQFDPD